MATAVVVASAIAGALPATWNFRVLFLLPAISLLAAIALPIGIVERGGPGAIAVQIIAAVVALQLSYLATFLFARPVSWLRTFLRMRPVHATRRMTARTPSHIHNGGARR
jgi:hypothetical protein